MDPATIALISTALAAAAEGAGSYYNQKQAKNAAQLRGRETQRETQAGLFNEAYNRGSELEAHGMASRAKLGKRRSQSLQDTADLVRGAFSI